MMVVMLVLLLQHVVIIFADIQKHNKVLEISLIIKYFLQVSTFETTNTEVPGSIPGHSLGFF
jgi:hypothetical protein